MEILDLLTLAKKNKASDIHLMAGARPYVRIHGDVEPVLDTELTPDQVKGMIYSVMTDSQRASFEKEMEVDFAIQFGEMRFRVNTFTTMNGVSAVFREIPTKILSLEDLNLPPIFSKIATLEKGLVLVTGPTGSGKSTTLAAIVNEINKNDKKHILTVEDPIEFVHKPKKCIINQRELHNNTKSFSAALKSALREDPDVILVGEMRDLETISLALTAAETGHLVFGTLHTSSAPKTIDRIVDVFPAADKELVRSMLSSSIQAVIAQSLLKTADGKGRVGAFEVMLGTPSIRNLIRENKIPQITSLIQIGSKYGMVTMKDYLGSLVASGKITADSAAEMLNMISGKPDFDEGTVATNTNPHNKEEPPAKKSFFGGGKNDDF
jgi:twitching motility protein PilT